MLEKLRQLLVGKFVRITNTHGDNKPVWGACIDVSKKPGDTGDLFDIKLESYSCGFAAQTFTPNSVEGDIPWVGRHRKIEVIGDVLNFGHRGRFATLPITTVFLFPIPPHSESGETAYQKIGDSAATRLRKKDNTWVSAGTTYELPQIIGEFMCIVMEQPNKLF